MMRQTPAPRKVQNLHMIALICWDVAVVVVTIHLFCWQSCRKGHAWKFQLFLISFWWEFPFFFSPSQVIFYISSWEQKCTCGFVVLMPTHSAFFLQNYFMPLHVCAVAFFKIICPLFGLIVQMSRLPQRFYEVSDFSPSGENQMISVLVADVANRLM